MRRFLTAVASTSLIAGLIVTGAPAVASADTLPAVTQLSQSQFVAQATAAAQTFAATFTPDKALEGVYTTTGRGVTTTETMIFNPDGSFSSLTDSTDDSDPLKGFKCLTPVKGEQDCYDLTDKGLWTARTSTNAEPFSISGLGNAIGTLIEDEVKNTTTAADQYGAPINYTFMTVDGVPTYTVSYSTTARGEAVVFSFPAGKFMMAEQATSGRGETVQLAPIAPVPVTRPLPGEIDREAMLLGDINAIAKQLETDYTDNAVYPAKVLRVEVSPDSTFRICYNTKKNPQYYTILGSIDGGRTFWVYKSNDGGMQLAPVTSKTGRLPACKTLKATDNMPKPTPMVNGPKILRATYR